MKPSVRSLTRVLLASFLVATSVPATCQGQSTSRSMEDPKSPKLNLPDPLISNAEKRIKTAREWKARRRDELKDLFERVMYGKIPAAPEEVDVVTQLVDKRFLEGRATLKLLQLKMGPGNGPKIDVLVVVPNQRLGPAPTFVAMNFCGNHAVVSDPRVPLSKGWLYSSCKGCESGRATEASRGSQSKDWPIEELMARGYALVSFASSDIDSDRADVSDGIYAWLAELDPLFDNRPHDRGTIAAWAWGFSRVMDYVVTDRDLDPLRAAAVGHSRNGKTALLAAAFDERFALAIPHQAGCGGTAPSRGKKGESVKQINDRFPHWFNAKFKEYNEETGRLPIDQNCLVALMAPRPVLLSNAEEDTWANPEGQFDVLRGAASVYKLLGVEQSGLKKRPPIGTLLKGSLGYYVRPGKHSMTSGDWAVFMDYADAHFLKKFD